jgi:hypothetical protein
MTCTFSSQPFIGDQRGSLPLLTDLLTSDRSASHTRQDTQPRKRPTDRRAPLPHSSYRDSGEKPSSSTLRSVGQTTVDDRERKRVWVFVAWSDVSR